MIAASTREEALLEEMGAMREAQLKNNEELLSMRERVGVLQAELKQQLHGGAQLQAQMEARKDQLHELKENVELSRQARRNRNRSCNRNCADPLLFRSHALAWDGFRPAVPICCCFAPRCRRTRALTASSPPYASSRCESV